MVAGLIVALDPNCVTRGVDLRTETLFTLLLIAGVCVLAWQRQQPWGWFWAGLLWSLADEESLAWHDHISRTFPTPRDSRTLVFRDER